MIHNHQDRALLILCSLGLSLICGQSAHADDELSQKLAKADALMDHRKPKAAEGILKDLIASHPDSAQAHMQLGAALATLANNDEYDAAIAEEQTALKLDPKSYGARKILGHIYTNMGKTKESVAILEEACAINPSSYGAQRDLGIALTTAGNSDEAIKVFHKAIGLNPNKVDSHLKLSDIFLTGENYKDAITEARNGLKLDLANPESHLALGNALLAAGNKADAMESFDAAMQANIVKGYRNPLTQAKATSGLGWALAYKDAGKKDLDEAISDQRQAIKLYSSFGTAYIRLAELLSRQGNNKEAEIVYKTSLKLSAQDAGVTTAYAKFLDKIGRSDEARSILKGVLEKSPNYKQASEALSKLGQNKTN